MSRNNFGNQVAGNQNVQFPPADSKAVCRFQNTTGGDLLVDKLYAHWNPGSGTAKVKGVIYSDNAGSPDVLLATSNEKVGVASYWDGLTFPTPLLIAAGDYVWFGVISDTMCVSDKCLSGGTILYNSNTYTSGPSSTFGSATSASYTYRMFLEGEDTTASFGRRSIDITSIASGDGNYQPDREHIEKCVLGGAASVNVTSISTYIRNTSATAKSKAAIYADSAGYPGAKLAQSVEVTGSTADTWLTLSIPGGLFLSPGTYWIGFITSENLTTPVIPFTGHLIVDGPMTEASAFDPTYPTGSPVVVFDPVTDGRGIDIYATYGLTATYSTSFDSYTTDALPSDWTARWVTTNTNWLVRAKAGAEGGKTLENTGTNTGRHLLTWNAIDADANRADVEILVRYRPSTSSTELPRLTLRGSGAAGAENGYFVSFNASSLNFNLAKFVAGTQTNLGSTISHTTIANVWYYVRFRANGTTLQMRRWKDGEVEPSAWELTVTDSSITAAGWVGIGNQDPTGTRDTDWFSVGTNGAPAPLPTATTTQVRTSQAVAEVAHATVAPGRVSQVIAEVAHAPLAPARISQMVVEAAISAPIDGRISQMVVEVAFANVATVTQQPHMIVVM